MLTLVGLLKFLKTKYDADKLKLDNKIPDTSKLVKNVDYSANIIGMKSKISSIRGLPTNSALTAVKNKIPDVSRLDKKKTDYNTIITETENKFSDHNHDKYIASPEFNKLTGEVFYEKLAQLNYFYTELKSLNQKIISNKAKHFLAENELRKTTNI